MQCNTGQAHGSLVPIFVTLKEFAEDLARPTLLDYIGKQLQDCGIDKPEIKALQMRHSDNIAMGSGAQTATMVQQVIILLYVLHLASLFRRSR